MSINEALATLLGKVVSKLRHVDPANSTLYLAMYLRVQSETNKPYVTLTKNGKDYKFRHTVWFDPKPVILDSIGKDNLPVYKRDWEASPNDQLKAIYMQSFSQFTDFIYDSEHEMRVSGFPFARELTVWTKDERKEIFSKNLGDINERPSNVGDGRKFMQAVADFGTYNDDGHYYEKWDDQKKRKTSKVYQKQVEATREEIVLAEGLQYVYVATDDGGKVYSVNFVGDGMYLDGHSQTGSMPLLNDEELADARKKKYDIYFILETKHDEGEKREPVAPHRWHKLLGDSQQASHMVVDPRHMVKASLPKQLWEKVNNAGQDDWYWFEQMVIDVFPERIYRLPTVQAENEDSFLRAIGGLGQFREDVNKGIVKSLDGLDGGKPITGAAKADVVKQLDDPNWIIIPQGLKTSGATRFVGFDGEYVFERDLESGLVYTMPLTPWLSAMAMGKFYGQIAEDTGWLVYMMEGVVIVAAVAVGGWAAFAGMSSMTAREFAIKVAKKEVKDEILHQLIEAAKPAIVSAVLALIDAVGEAALKDLAKRTGNASLADAAAYLGRVKNFLLGFLKGYTVLNLEARFRNAVAKALPMEAQAVILSHKLYKAVEKIRKLLLTVENELTQPAIAEGLHNLEIGATFLIRGLTKVMGMIHYLDHDQAKPWMELLGSDDPQTAATREEWEKATKDAIANITKKLKDAADAVNDAADYFDIGNTEGIVVAALVGSQYLSYLSQIVTPAVTAAVKGIHGKFGWKGDAVLGLGIMAIWATATVVESDDPLKSAEHQIQAIGSVLEETFIHLFPGDSEDQAEVNGKLIGQLVGSIWVDKTLLGEKSFLGKKLANKGLAGKLGMGAIKGTIGGSMVSGIVKVVLHRYIGLAERLAFLGTTGMKGLRDMLDAERVDDLKDKGLGHLEQFRASSDSAMTLAGLVGLLKKLHEVTTKDLQDFASHYEHDIVRLREDLASGVDLLDKFGVGKFMEEQTNTATMVIAAHMYSGVQDMLKALDAIFKPFTKSDFSWVTLLVELGMEWSGDFEGLRRDVKEALQPQIDALKQQ